MCPPVKQKELMQCFRVQESLGIQNIPIFIINFNRLECLKLLIKNLEKYGYKNIYIIDNASKYPPLLDFYNECKYEVFRMEHNEGHMVFWKNEVFKEWRKNFYVVTDPDVIPIEECPTDFLKYFFGILKKYPFVRKVGFSLRIDDLPPGGIFTKEVLEWEMQFFKKKIIGKNIYYAEIDTTFALYLPDQLCFTRDFLKAFRTGYPYQARHLPWYKTINTITEEDRYYDALKTNGWWSFVKGEVTKD